MLQGLQDKLNQCNVPLKQNVLHWKVQETYSSNAIGKKELDGVLIICSPPLDFGKNKPTAQAAGAGPS